MYPNAIVMTPEQFADLKESLIRELEPKIKSQVEEERRKHSSAVSLNVWPPIRDEALHRLRHLVTYNRYQVVNALSTIVRNSLGVSNVQGLTTDQAQAARDIVDAVVSTMLKYSKPKAGEQGEHTN
ncbi:hypothetical protein [Paenibacillus terrae]|uniref:Uncharacterized protein n=1 Tax=Paenibacillus terrae TaxID=159743 RepID=A0A0D7WTI0_9BACL|nr:hypothetical protein [Paenibacillus terrae]KJD42470.1 hypothetical protein QD47_28065 [Paenibacillus terrae]